MPRLRRQGRRRRERPQLAIGVWRWLQSGGENWETLDEGTKWDTWMLTDGRIFDPEFWERVIAAVEAGEIEISTTKEHCQWDPPLFPPQHTRINASY
jgi:hypothetical protein